MALKHYDHATYESRYKGFRVDARGPEPIRHPVTGATIGNQRELVAEFGVFGGEFTPRDEKGEALYHDQFGQPMVFASIRGGQWDSRVWAEQGDYDEDEVQTLLAAVEHHCRQQPDVVWRKAVAVPVAPWPNYPKQTPKNIVSFAIESGMILEALSYEKATENRKLIVDELEAAWEEKLATDQAAEQLTVA